MDIRVPHLIIIFDWEVLRHERFSRRISFPQRRERFLTSSSALSPSRIWTSSASRCCQCFLPLSPDCPASHRTLRGPSVVSLGSSFRSTLSLATGGFRPPPFTPERFLRLGNAVGGFLHYSTVVIFHLRGKQRRAAVRERAAF